MTPWLLIPVKSLHTGKSRLRPVLADDARRALNEFFLRRMLEVARRFPGCERTAVISDCGDVLQIATGCSIHAIHQSSGPGLNRAAREGVDTLRRLGARDIVLIACDAPMVGPSDLREFEDPSLTADRIVICPDRHGTGTNAVFVPSGVHMEFQFGDDSFSLHCREALRCGSVPKVHLNPRIGLDIDTPEDLASWFRDASQRPSTADAPLASRLRE